MPDMSEDYHRSSVVGWLMMLLVVNIVTVSVAVNGFLLETITWREQTTHREYMAYRTRSCSGSLCLHRRSTLWAGEG